MARNINSTKLSRQNNGASPAVSRRNSPVATLYLMQLRSQALKISAQPRRVRLEIHADAAEDPTPVKIKKKD